MVTAVIGDFTGSFTSLASSFGGVFIIPSPPQPPGSSGVERRWGQSAELPPQGSKRWWGEQAERTSPKPRLRVGQGGPRVGPGLGLSPAACTEPAGWRQGGARG